MEEKLTPDFDTRKPQKPNERLSMANGRRSLLLGGVLLLVAIAVPIGMEIYAYAKLSEQPIFGSSVHPNGKIAFVRGNSVGHNVDNIYLVDPDGTNETRLTHTREEEDDPVWSPDGEKLAFLRTIDSYNTSIYVIDSDGTNETRLTRAMKGQVGGLTWSPDGKKIASYVESEMSNAMAIYVMNADGTGRIRVAEDLWSIPTSNSVAWGSRN